MAPLGLQLFAAFGLAPKAVDTGPPSPGGPPLFAAGLQKEVDAIEPKSQATLLDLLEQTLKNGLAPSPDDSVGLDITVGDTKVKLEKPQLLDLLSSLGVSVPPALREFDPATIVKALVSPALEAAIPKPVKDLMTAMVQPEGRIMNPTLSRPKPMVEPTGQRPLAPPPPADVAPFAVNLNRPMVAPDADALLEAGVDQHLDPSLIDVAAPQTVGSLWKEAPLNKKPVANEQTHAKPIFVGIKPRPHDFFIPYLGGPRPSVSLNHQAFQAVPLTQPVVDPTSAKPVVNDTDTTLGGTLPIDRQIVAALNVALVQVEQNPQPAVLNTALTERVTAASQTGEKPKIKLDIAKGKTESQSKEETEESGAKPKADATGAKPVETKTKDEPAPFIKDEDQPHDDDALAKPDPAIGAKPREIQRATAKPQAIDRDVHTEIRQKIVDQVQEMAAIHGRQRVTIKLNPEDLGTLTLSVISTNENVEAKVTASNDSVRHSLSAHRADLVQGIESRGLNLGSFTVGQENQADPNHAHKNNQQDVRQDFSRAFNLATPRAEAPIQTTTNDHKGVDTLA